MKVQRIMLVLALVSFICIGNASGQDAKTTTAPSSVSTFKALVDLLVKDSVPFQRDKNGKPLVFIMTEKGPIDGSMIISWAAEDGVVHFIQAMPVPVTDKNLPAILGAIVRLNHDFPVPGLGLADDNELYFRMTVPIMPRGGLEPQEVRTYFSYTLAQAAKLTPTMQAVAAGKVSPENATQYYVTTQQQAKTPSGKFTTQFANSTWTIDFDGEGTVRLFRDGKEAVNSACKFEGGKVTFKDRSGALAAEGVGVYQWKLEGGTLRFVKLSDESKGRTMVLTASAWKRG